MKKRNMKKHEVKHGKEETMKCKTSCGCGCGCGGCLYFLGAIGAAVYYIQQATGFWMGVLGILKALVWPAFLVYQLLGF